jgi:peptidoglycan/LPS O-acetylase OafA/YrhL
MSEAPRRDIQAVRAVAVAMVVVFLLWPAALPGGYIGVDVFLVVSGYLITLHLLRRPPTSGGELANFWARRVRRLLPAATASLVGTALLALLLIPATTYAALARATVASAFAVENWNLIALSSDYLAADDNPSPVQHFWSLGVEEQFYFVWPLIIAACMLPLLRRYSRRVVGVAILGVILVSFAGSVYFTGHGSAFAYFATVTRVWELGIGAAVAVAHNRVVGRGPTWLRLGAWWAGAAAIVVASITFADVSEFPGYRAALPVLGTAAMIVVSGDALRGAGARVFASAPMQWVGDRSYSIYLWHWPLIVAITAVVAPGLWATIAVLVGTAVLAALSKRWLEDVPRTAPRLVGSRRATAGLLVACTALSVAAAGAVWAVQDAQGRRGEVMLAAAAGDACLGAGEQLDPSCEPRAAVTTPVHAAQDKPVVYDDDCWNGRPFTRRAVCHYGDPQGEVNVALVGNSHSGQWQPPIAATATSRGWGLDTYLASECYPVDVLIDFGSATTNQNCLELQNWAVDEIVTGDYQAVVIASRTHQPLADVPKAEQYDEQVASYARVLTRFVDAGQAVLVIRDTPYPAHDIPECLASKVSRDCSTARERALPPDPLVEAAQSLASPAVTVLDMSDVLCGDTVCDPVMGGLITNFDQGHFTASFAATLEPWVSEALDATVASGKAKAAK